MLRELAQRLELQGGNRFRARAYQRAADNLLLTPIPVAQLIAQGRLRDIPGVGPALEAVITELQQTGQHAALNALRQQFPAGVLELMRLPGLRSDRVRKLYQSFGIQSLVELERVARSGQLAVTKGFGPAFQAKVLRDLEIAHAPPARHLHRAYSAMQYLRDELLHAHPQWSAVTAAGETRRGCELVHSLSLVAVLPEHAGPSRRVELGDGNTVHLSAPRNYGATLLLATGSEQHIGALRERAAQRGWVLDSEGLRTADGVRIASETEESLYAALDLPFIAPELRETGDEVHRALQGRLPALVTPADMRGVLHAHTDQSDGADTLEAMARAAQARGYAYLGLTDHSQTAHYAGGMSVSEVQAQQQAIDALNARLTDFRIFKGIESDILADGSLDYPEEVLRSFEFVIASVHSRFRMTREQQTERILTAIANPHTVILGHLTGRLLLKRPGYELDMERILAACAQHGVAVEINANPWRLDLDWRWCQRAVELGCWLSVNPDAHATAEIDNMQWGVLMARKGAVPRGRILNSLNRAEFAAHLRDRRAHAHCSPRE